MIRRLVFVLMSIVASNSLLAQVYKIDPGHTAITTKVMRFGVVKVVGRFTDVSGLVKFDLNQIGKASAEIIIKTESYTANNIEGEKAVKSIAFLDVATYPEIKFSVKKIQRHDKGYVAEGDLTIHGVTKNVSFPVTINGPALDLPTGKQSIGISGSLIINRQDYGISMSRKMPNGNDVIGNEVEIEINALALAQ